MNVSSMRMLMTGALVAAALLCGSRCVCDELDEFDQAVTGFKSLVNSAHTINEFRGKKGRADFNTQIDLLFAKSRPVQQKVFANGDVKDINLPAAVTGVRKMYERIISRAQIPRNADGKVFRSEFASRAWRCRGYGVGHQGAEHHGSAA